MQIKKVFRQERKFLISGEQYYRFSRQFAELFKEDSHNGKDGYMVRPCTSIHWETKILKKNWRVLSVAGKCVCGFTVLKVGQHF